MKSAPRSILPLTAAISLALLAQSAHATFQNVRGIIEARASQLDEPGDAHAWLSEQFEAGVPILVRMDTPDRSPVARFFGISSRTGDTIFVRGTGGDVSMLRPTDTSVSWRPQWTPRATEALAIMQANAPTHVPDGSSITPLQRFHEGVFETGSDEITGRATIVVVRSATRTDDDKEIHVSTWHDIKPENAGIDAGHAEGRNLSAFYLPVRYHISHEVTASGNDPVMVDFFPHSDGSTTIEYTKIQERGISIGGNVGSGASEDGKADAGLASKIPFNVSVGFTHTEREEFRLDFQDYSLAAGAVSSARVVRWEAPLSERLFDTLIEAEHADSVELSEKRMTPMMRTARLPAWSVWEVPGVYEGMARVTVSGGYDIDEHKWWWQGSEWMSSGHQVRPVEASASFELDLSSPYLTREITVLLRSAAEDGQCMAQRSGHVVMAACDARDRAQMWGLDSERRYVNRQSGECLEADIAGGSVAMGACSLGTSQTWQWRADRIHSAMGNSQNRLFVDDGKLRVVADVGRFDDIPENPHNALLKPWAGYPRAPVEGELQPAPFGTAAGSIPAGWAGIYGATGPEQRWTPIVLRVGIVPEA
ncbi:MAG: RICIN domain-containing protein [Luteibacter sp.]